MTAILLGLACAAGLALTFDGLTRRSPRPRRWRHRTWTARDQARAIAAVGVGVACAVVTRWPVAALLAAAGVWTLPRMIGTDREHQRALARTEAVATWAELLRDTLSAAAGLEQAIFATSLVAPGPIRAPVRRLAEAVDAGVPLPDALRVFADDLADPTADLVVQALRQAAGHHGGRLAGTLTSLAATAREQAAIRMRVTTARAATRTAVRVITGTCVVMVAALIALNRGFLAPYQTLTGQLALLAVGALFAGGLGWLARMSRIPEPPRILGPTPRTRPTSHTIGRPLAALTDRAQA